MAGLKVDSRQFTSGLNKSRGALSSFANYAKKTFIAVGAASAAGATALGVMAVKMAADAEQTAIAFEVMTGSATRAGKLIADLRKMGAATPFEFTDLAASTKTLLSFGRTADQVLGDLDMLSNIASGDAQKLSSLSLVFGQIAANSRMTGGDLLQLVNTGFNPLNQIATKTGETMLELRTRMSKGLIGFEEVRQAFKDATSAGGLFYKMNEKQSQTLLGKWSTMKDEINSALLMIGDSLAKNLDLKKITENITEMATVFKDDWVPALEEMIRLAPKLLEAFGQVGKAVNAVAGFVDNALDRWEKANFVVSGFLAGQSLDEMRSVYNDMQTGGFGAGHKSGEIKPNDPDFLEKTSRKFREEIMNLPFAERREKTKEFEEKQLGKLPEGVRKFEEENRFKSQFKKLENPAEQMLAGIIRDGIGALQSGVMSLGPKAGPVQSQVGSLEKGSQEAFDVLRANTKPSGGKDIPKQQLAETKVMSKVMQKIQAKLDKGLKLSGHEQMLVVVKGLDD